MRIGDVVRVIPDEPRGPWPECFGEIGVIVKITKRLHIPSAMVMVLGEVTEFDLDELERVDENYA